MAILKATANPVKRGGLQQSLAQQIASQFALPGAVALALLYKFVWVPRRAKKSGEKQAGTDAAATKAAAPAAVARSKPRRDYKVKRQDDEELRAAAAQARLEAMAAAASLVPEDYEEGDDEQEGQGTEAAAGGAQAAGGQGNFLSMLQKLGYKVVMPSDGSGQVYLVPPGGEEGAADDDEVSTGEDTQQQQQPSVLSEPQQPPTQPGQAAPPDYQSQRSLHSSVSPPSQQPVYHQHAATHPTDEQASGQQPQAAASQQVVLGGSQSGDESDSVEHVDLTGAATGLHMGGYVPGQQGPLPPFPHGQYMDIDMDEFEDDDYNLDLDYDLDDLLMGPGGGAGVRFGNSQPPLSDDEYETDEETGDGGARGRSQGGYLPGARVPGGGGAGVMGALSQLHDFDTFDDLMGDEGMMDEFDAELAEMIMNDMLADMSAAAPGYAPDYTFTDQGPPAYLGGEDMIAEGDEEGYDEDEAAEEEFE